MVNPHGLSLANDGTLLVCDGRAGLKVFNAANTSNIRALTTVPNLYAYDVIYDESKKVSIISNSDGWDIYRMVTPSNPRFLSSITNKHTQ